MEHFQHRILLFFCECKFSTWSMINHSNEQCKYVETLLKHFCSIFCNASTSDVMWIPLCFNERRLQFSKKMETHFDKKRNPYDCWSLFYLIYLECCRVMWSMNSQVAANLIQAFQKPIPQYFGNDIFSFIISPYHIFKFFVQIKEPYGCGSIYRSSCMI